MHKRFITLFPSYEDYHFFKDPGQIPFRMKDFGYKTKIVSYNNSQEYFFTNKYLDHELLTSKGIKSRKNYYILKYLYNNSKKIDILNLFHIRWITLLYSYIYKAFNNNGVVYLKLDNCCYGTKYDWQMFLEEKIPVLKFKRKIKQALFSYFFSYVDLFSVEDSDSCEAYSKYDQFRNKIIVAYNGYTCDLFSSNSLKDFSTRENNILTVGNLGSFSKNTEMLLEAFGDIAQSIPGWRLHLAGKIYENLTYFLDDFLKEKPWLKEKIVFHGYLEKEELFSLYNCSKIFVLPSKYETFANVFCEAFYYGNVIITTETVSPRELIRDKCGIILKEITSTCLASELKNLIDDPELQKNYSDNSLEISTQLNWKTILQQVNIKIKQIILVRRKNNVLNFFVKCITAIYVIIIMLNECYTRRNK